MIGNFALQHEVHFCVRQLKINGVKLSVPLNNQDIECLVKISTLETATYIQVFLGVIRGNFQRADWESWCKAKNFYFLKRIQ